MSSRLVDVTGGYGNVYKEVMKIPDISIEAKAIYGYLSSYAGGNNIAFPSVSLICHELNISENRFRKYKDELVERGIITVRRNRTDNGFSKNIYTINHHFVSRQFEGIQNVSVQKLGQQNVGVQNKSTKNNNHKNNNIKKNNENNNSSSGASTTQQQPPNSHSNVFNFYQENGFGMLRPIIVDQISNWIDDFNNNEDIVIEAFKEAASNNVFKWSYVNSILRNWSEKGVKSVEDINAYKKQRDTQKKTTQIDDEEFDNSQYANLF